MAMFHIDAKDESAWWAFFCKCQQLSDWTKNPEFRSWTIS